VINTMPAIKSTGAYIPFYRLKREEIARAWGVPGRGEKAIANHDEDSLTLAVEAGRDCLKGIDRQSIDGLYFASTTSPYGEKQCAVTVASALDLKKDIFTADFTDSLRAGTNALRAAMDAVKAGSAKNVLVVAAESRIGNPGSDFEQNFGDGAAALLISDTGEVIIDSNYAYNNEIIDQWRTSKQEYTRAWEDRFVVVKGYVDTIKEATTAFLKQLNLTVPDFNKVILSAADVRRHQEGCRTLKLDPKEQVQNPMLDTVGNTGTALALMMLVAAIEEAGANDRLLLINHGDGCDLFTFQVKEKPSFNEERRGINGYLNSKIHLESYEKYLRLRKIIDVEGGRRRPPIVSSAVAINRDRNMIYRLHAYECTSCGRSFFPPQRVCLYCKAKDQYKEIPLSEEKGTLYTFCKDMLAQSLDQPVIISVVNLKRGLRFYGQMTDRDPDKVELDMSLEFTFRKMSEAEGYNNYFWKCRPIR
jgi:3-hydroxy-3-methylglutaryl CoA synthase